MATPPLSPPFDPTSLAKLQVLLLPISDPSTQIYAHYSTLFRRHTSLRGDEVKRHTSQAIPGHTRAGSIDTRSRFLPSQGNTSISKPTTSNHVHLSFQTQPPARHLLPLSLLRIASFPLIVIGIAVDESTRGYAVETDGDLGESSSRGSDVQRAFEGTLSALFPEESALPLVRRLVVVPGTMPRSPRGPASPGVAAKGKGKDEGYMRYAPESGADAWTARIIGEAVGEVMLKLGELVCYFYTMEAQLSIDIRYRPLKRRQGCESSRQLSCPP